MTIFFKTYSWNLVNHIICISFRGDGAESNQREEANVCMEWPLPELYQTIGSRQRLDQCSAARFCWIHVRRAIYEVRATNSTKIKFHELDDYKSTYLKFTVTVPTSLMLSNFDRVESRISKRRYYCGGVGWQLQVG